MLVIPVKDSGKFSNWNAVWNALALNFKTMKWSNLKKLFLLERQKDICCYCYSYAVYMQIKNNLLRKRWRWWLQMVLLCKHSHTLQINYDSVNFYCSFSCKNFKNATMLKKSSWGRSKRIKNNWNLWCLSSYQRKSHISQDIQYLFISIKTHSWSQKKKKDTTVKRYFCSVVSPRSFSNV